jgi:uncharacterized protein (TIGR02646 family)
MRQISNRTEPVSFIEWKKKNNKEGWDKFSGTDVYKELKEYLRFAQENMCCYCEIAVKQNTDAHIEHLKSRHHFPNDRFKFDNLYACCQSHDTCGHAKGSTDSSRMILPDSDCEPRFTYTDNGVIIPAREGDQEVLDTIRILDLNNKRLRDRRKTIIRTLEDVNDTELIEEYLINCVEYVEGFYTVIKYVQQKG